MNQDYLPTQYQQYIALSRYARWRDDLGRREFWPETVQRWVDFWERYLSNNGDVLPAYLKATLNEIQDSILNLKVMPSMRGLMTAGPALERDHVAGYNCSFLLIQEINAFPEVMWLLMNGCGVGFSVERQFVINLPTIAEEFYPTDSVISVADSKLGWAHAFKELLSLLWQGRIPKWDLSKVRAAGMPLKIFGGRASGPGPLDSLFKFTVHTFRNAAGRKLNSIECHDLVCKIGEIVVVGGTRRSACISLSNLSDDRMRNAKNGQWWVDYNHRKLANNSVAYTERPDYEVFLKEWFTLYESKSGERGLFNRVAATKKAKENGRRKTDGVAFGTNPCQPTSATVLTPNGISTMGAINIGDTIWSGYGWTKVINKVCTGIKPVHKYQTTAGYFLGTENHKIFQNGERVEVKGADLIDTCQGPEWFEASPLDNEDIMDGWVIGDGSVHKASNNLVYLCVGEKDIETLQENLWHMVYSHRPGLSDHAYEVFTSIQAEELPRTWERCVPSRFKFGSFNKVRGFLRGLYAANGSMCGNRIALKATSFQMIQDVQEMLSTLGIISYYTVNKPTEIEFENGVYLCKESYDLNVSDRTRFSKCIGFIHKYKQSRLDSVIDAVGKSRLSRNRRKSSYEIIAIDSLGEEKVYDITVQADEHSYWTGGLLVSNCGEINLRHKQLCNLSEVVVRCEDTLDILKEKVRIATIIGTFQSLLTDFRFLSKEWQKNCEEERLLGVSLTGVMDHSVLSIEYDDLHKDVKREDGTDWLGQLKIMAIDTNKIWAEKLGINQSVAITCNKPSGTVSQLCNSSSGIHPRHNPYYIRRVLGDDKDPITQFMIAEGVPNEKSVNYPSHIVFSFPIKSPEGSICRKDIDALAQLRIYKTYRDHWTEHNPSISVYYEDKNFLGVGQWVWENFDDISGIAFFPTDNGIYQQAPYEDITKEEYERLAAAMPVLDWSKLAEYEKDDRTKGSRELACQGGQCEL